MTSRGFSQTLLDKAVTRFERRPNAGRRSMIKRSAVVATALVAAPTDFLLRPKTAYAAVCRCVGQACPCGSTCCDRYTEFCCTLTGENGCPPGTIAGGWWKVDGSGFCGGSPRYYLDCNAQCGSCGCRGGLCDGSCSGTRCGCAWGDCNLRKVGCTKFRYGQCNQHVACMGPIVCRVVTCTPPWVFDGSCTTDSRTDNNTANHNSSCLQRPFGAFDGIQDVGGAIRVVGWAIDENLRDGVEVRVFIDQDPMVTTMANLHRPDVGAAYPYYGPDHGFDATIPATPGRHVVCVLAVDQGSQAARFLAFNVIDVAGPSGTIDSAVGDVGSFTLIGWVINQHNPTQLATIRVLLDGVEVWSGVTNADRQDLPAIGIPSNAGFSVSLPTTPGLHDACVELVHSSGRVVPLACRQVEVR